MDWAINYEKHRDIFKKEIASIEPDFDGYDLKITYKDKEKFILIMPVLANIEDLRLKLKDGRSITIITLNSKVNLDFVFQNWQGLIDFPGLIMIFINPFSLTDIKWMIRPHIHNKITEGSALKKGLKTMFDTVSPITEDKFLKKVKAEN